MKRTFAFLLIGCALLVHCNSYSQLILTNAADSATIDFSSSTQTSVGSNPSTAYNASGFTANPTSSGKLNSNAWAVTGWSDGSLSFGGTQTTSSTDYTRGAVSIAQNVGGFYAFTGSPASSSNPMFYIQLGGSDFAPGTLTLRIKNSGTTNITSLSVSYDLYVRNDQIRGSTFNFSYSTDSINYNDVSSLNYSTPVAADALGLVHIGGTTFPSRSTIINSLSIPPNGYVYIRWSSDDLPGAGGRDEIGLDNITVAATYAAVVLPINLTSFTVSRNGAMDRLDWVTSCTSTAQQFNVEWSDGSTSFTTVGTRGETGEACKGEHVYTLDIPSSTTPRSLYRLAMKDLSGGLTHSKTVSINNISPDASIVTIAPNPACSQITVQGIATGTQWQISDAQGRVLKAGTLETSGIRIEDLAPSMYFLQCAGVHPARFVKQ
jgi:hypothetical protein